MVAAAVIGGLGAAGSVIGASKAADAQKSAANAAIAQQNSMYNQNKNLLAPYINAGTAQLPGLQAYLDPTNTASPLNTLTRLLTPGADMSAVLEQTPGYQFNLSQGLRAANNALAARGLGGSGGAVAKGAADYASGLAGNTWQNVVNSLQNLFTSGSGAMQNLVNTGAQSGNALAGVGTNVANANSSALIGSGSAQAAASNAIGNALGSGGGLTAASLLSQLQGGASGIYGSTPNYGQSYNIAGGGYAGMPVF